MGYCTPERKKVVHLITKDIVPRQRMLIEISETTLYNRKHGGKKHDKLMLSKTKNIIILISNYGKHQCNLPLLVI